MFAPQRRLIGALVAVMGLLAGCGGTAPSVPPSTPLASEEPTPSPTPHIDVADAFLAAMGDKDFAMVATIDGTMQVGADVAVVSGELRVSGSDTYLLLEAQSASATAKSERLTVAGRQYERESDGLWMLTPTGEPVTGSLTSALDLSSVTDEGVEQLNGTAVHRLEPHGAQIAPSMFGLNDPSITDFEGTLYFLAEDDGTPAGMRQIGTWQQLQNGEPASCRMDITYAFGRVGGYVSIEDPRVAWQWRESSSLGYAMAYPTDWDVTEEPASDEYLAYDYYFAPVDAEVHVTLYSDYPADLPAAQIFRELADYVSDGLGTRIDSFEDLTVAGMPARLLRAHYVDASRSIFFQGVTIVGDGSTWDVQWYSGAGAEESDRLLFLDFISTFAPRR